MPTEGTTHMAGSPGGKEVGRISIRILPDTSRFRETLRKELVEVEKTLRAKIGVDVDLETATARGAMTALMARLKAQGAKGVDVNVGIDQSQTAQVQALATKLGGLASSAGSAGEGLAGVGRTGAIVAAVAAAAAPAVALIAGLLAGLPSIAAAFGAAGGAIALGLDGIKKSAAQLIPSLDGLKASVSGVFEARLTPIFEQLGKIFPTLETGMGAVANGLSDIAKGFVDVVTSGPGLAQIQNILAQTGTFFTNLSPVISTFTQSFLTLASSGASAFGQLLAPLQTFATGFNDVVNRLTSNGSFEAAMGGLSQVLGSVLGLFNRLFESGVQAMGQLGGPIATLVNGLGDAFVALMPALTSFSTLIGNVLGTALSALAPAITAITPAFTALADTLGTLFTSNITTLAPVLTQIATAIGTTLTTALTQLQPMLPGLISAFQSLVSAVSGQLAQYLPQLAASFGQMLGAIIPLLPQLVQFGTTIATSVIPVLAQIAPIVAAVVAAFATLVTGVAGAATSFLDFVTRATAAVSGLPGQITGALSSLPTLLVQSGKDLIQGLINGVKSMVGSAIAAVQGVASSITGAIKGALGINSPSKVFAEIGSYSMQGLNNGLLDGSKAVVKTAKDIAAQVGDAMAPSGSGNAAFDGLQGKLAGVGANFFDANAQQAFSDFGIGGGALSAALEQGASYAKQAITNIHVNSIDEALAAKQTITNKNALTWTQR